MIKVEHIETWGFEHAIRGCRNPLQSHDKSDSRIANTLDAKTIANVTEGQFILGENDLDLMRRLCKAGQDGNFAHRKFLRQVFVSMDITAPDYFFKEFSTYKVGVVENSTSTMHRIHSKEFTLDDFSHEHMEEELGCLRNVVNQLNLFRNNYIESNRDKRFWWQMIQLLPMSYNYTRTVTMNYENVLNMIKQRTRHKLDEWNEFVDILWGLPYLKEIAGEDE